MRDSAPIAAGAKRSLEAIGKSGSCSLITAEVIANDIAAFDPQKLPDNPV